MRCCCWNVPSTDASLYHRAADSLGVEAHLCCAFEDSDPGTRAAVASGARVVQVPDLVQPSDAVRALGHVIAPDVLSGALRIGLLDRTVEERARALRPSLG